MDQIKIGKFIAKKRKEAGLTQAQLAEKLGITDRAVSKWETGRSLPDASVMLELCGTLQITVNELLCGEELSMEKNQEITENNLVEMVRQKEEADKRLLSLEIVIGVLSTVFLFALIGLSAYLMTLDPTKPWLGVLLIVCGFIQFIVCMGFALKIEQVAGYYECALCGHRYVPTYRSVNLAMHMGRTRYMKCPNCGKKSWQKKQISQE